MEYNRGIHSGNNQLYNGGIFWPEGEYFWQIRIKKQHPFVEKINEQYLLKKGTSGSESANFHFNILAHMMDIQNTQIIM